MKFQIKPEGEKDRYINENLESEKEDIYQYWFSKKKIFLIFTS